MKKVALTMVMMGAFTLGTNAQDKTADQQEIAFTQVETYPVYAGCESVEKIELQECFDKKVLEVVSRNFIFPESAKKAGVEGDIVVSFIIEKNGGISTVKLFKGIADTYEDDVTKMKAAKDLEKAALRAVQNLKITKPAMKGDKAVRMKYTVPISAKLK